MIKCEEQRVLKDKHCYLDYFGAQKTALEL